MITWRRLPVPDRISPIHDMQVPGDNASCRVCHTAGNDIGAAAMVLPAKSILCMPCHAATFSIGDTVTILSLLLFLISLAAVGSVWFSAGDVSSGVGERIMRVVRGIPGVLLSRRLLVMVHRLILDGLLQRRLFRVSKARWLLHALIFYPFMLRFIWGILALVGSLVQPPWLSAWVMLDKNHPLTAFVFDISGLMMIIGLAAMVLRGLQKRRDAAGAGLPPVDWPAYTLLGSIMATGFILEGMRISMTGSPAGAAYAFVGDAISRLLAGTELTGIYGYLWYLHAILTGAFLIYLPFSRMLHMISSPVVLAMNAADAKRGS
jgi:nitrate reductase gamma subunit